MYRNRPNIFALTPEIFFKYFPKPEHQPQLNPVYLPVDDHVKSLEVVEIDPKIVPIKIGNWISFTYLEEVRQEPQKGKVRL